MTNAELAVLRQRISKLEAALADLVGLPYELQEPLRDQLYAAYEALKGFGSVVLQDSAQTNVAIGYNAGTVIYGSRPLDIDTHLLNNYLTAVAARYSRLPLQGLIKNLAKVGSGLQLADVYTLLAVEGTEVAATLPGDDRYFYPSSANGGRMYRFEDLKPNCRPEHALPDEAIVRLEFPGEAVFDGATPNATSPISMPSGASSSDKVECILLRARLALEAVQKQQHLVLLGSPGSGKSTFIKHLAWSIAQCQLTPSESPLLPGLASPLPILLPVVLPLVKLANFIPLHDDSIALQEALVAEISALAAESAPGLVADALHGGKLLVLLDGLDEVPVRSASTRASRMAVLKTIQQFADNYPQARVVITCRRRAWSDKEQAVLGWPMELLSPWTLGQIRVFVTRFFRALNELSAAKYDPDEMACDLLTRIARDDSRPIREMVQNPLLLTMLCLVIYNKGSLPRDRPQLYEDVFALLLGGWEATHGYGTLEQALEMPGWTTESLLPIVEQLAYEVHSKAPLEDRRGRISVPMLRHRLTEFFRERADLPDDLAMSVAGRCLQYIDQRAGLLVPEENDVYRMAHLTLQEHAAGRHLILRQPNLTEAMRLRHDERWHEPLLLGLGVTQLQQPYTIVAFLDGLLDRHEPDGTLKPLKLWYRDLILAGEIGEDRDWTRLRTAGAPVPKLQKQLREGLVTLLGNRNCRFSSSERVKAGFLLGRLGDPRIPVSLTDYAREWQAAQRGETSYWCRVPTGTYYIGSSNADPDATDDEKPRHLVEVVSPYWLGRFPVTNAQWQEWVHEAGRLSYAHENEQLNGPNQPVVALPWTWCNAFCLWLSARCTWLPQGYEVRLATESEWELSARGTDSRLYPWGDKWQPDAVAIQTIEEPHAARTYPVGCFPKGASPCGAQDMVGNVGEWTCSRWESYPGAVKSFASHDRFVCRGGHARSPRYRLRCAARDRHLQLHYSYNIGFRMVVGPIQR